MTGGSKIIGMWRDRDDEVPLEGSEATIDGATKASLIDDEAAENEGDSADDSELEWTHYADESSVNSSPSRYIPPIVLGLAIAAWTVFFGWANRDIFTTMPTAKAVIDLFAAWCLPVATVTVLYLLYMRNSTREANRFGDVSLSLRAESELLETRLKTVNNELSIAREFLSTETRELEFLGDQSSQKLTSAASLIKTSLADGLNSMSKLDEVGDAAYKNLEQLREHLPVVINTAKDVTNQIGNTGRAAQTEMAGMLSTLTKIGQVGSDAKKSLDAVTNRSAEAVDILAQKADDIKTNLQEQLEHTELGSDKAAAVLKNTTTETIDALNQAREKLAQETSGASATLRDDLDALEISIGNVRQAADEEDVRLKALATELNASVLEISENMKLLDNDGGEQTAKLAFAMTALEQNSTALKDSLQNGYGVADGLTERVEKLLVALDSTSRELDETLPAAFDRVTEKSKTSMMAFGRIAKEAKNAESAADEITAKIETSGRAIAEQRTKLDDLRDSGSEASDVLLGKISNLAKSLEDVRAQNEALAENSGEKLINALLRVKETARQAADHSRDALEDAISGSAEKFEQISEEALNKIIDEKIGSIAPKLEAAVTKAVATTQSTAGHLTDQLSAIEDMTTNLEQRILFAKEKAEQSSDENFTRRVALLTESLNSTAIDVNKILSNEVTDTEWAAYLKGDRGIFTRRAVRLLDSGEVREILLQYDANSEFREHVNRYIHDFETMLRGVLSTRDGSAISVTLLSSDIGKLYVALAQAIERLRN